AVILLSLSRKRWAKQEKKCSELRTAVASVECETTSRLRLRLEHSLHKIERQFFRVPAESAVARAGGEHHLEILARRLQGDDQLGGILHVDVVIHQSVDEEQPAV